MVASAWAGGGGNVATAKPRPVTSNASSTNGTCQASSPPDHTPIDMEARNATGAPDATIPLVRARCSAGT